MNRNENCAEKTNHFYISKCLQNLIIGKWLRKFKKKFKILLLKFYIHILDNSYNLAIICAGNCKYWWWQYVLVSW